MTKISDSTHHLHQHRLCTTRDSSKPKSRISAVENSHSYLIISTHWQWQSLFLEWPTINLNVCVYECTYIGKTRTVGTACQGPSQLAKHLTY